MLLFWVQRSKVKVTRRINDHTVNAQYLPNGKAYEVQTRYTDGARRPISATSAVTWSKVKAQGRKVTWRVWQVSADKSRTTHPRNTKIGGKVTQYHPTGNNAYKFQGQRSKVKVTWSITLHNNTSFRTTVAFYSHSLGGDTSTITLPPRFIVIRYSLGGDTDKSNTAWVRTLHSRCSYGQSCTFSVMQFGDDTWRCNCRSVYCHAARTATGRCRLFSITRNVKTQKSPSCQTAAHRLCKWVELSCVQLVEFNVPLYT